MKEQKTGCQGGRNAAVKAVILYDHLDTLLAANQMLGWLSPGRGVAADWTVLSWRFDLLDGALEQERALDQSRDADLMAIAFERMHAPGNWPEGWLRRWAAERQAPNPLLMVILSGKAEHSQAESEVIPPLRGLAESGGLRMLLTDGTQAGDGLREATGLVDGRGTGGAPAGPAVVVGRELNSVDAGASCVPRSRLAA